MLFPSTVYRYELDSEEKWQERNLIYLKWGVEDEFHNVKTPVNRPSCLLPEPQAFITSSLAVDWEEALIIWEEITEEEETGKESRMKVGAKDNRETKPPCGRKAFKKVSSATAELKFTF